MDTRFAHVSIIAHDWRKLAGFYVQLLGCTPVPPERNLAGPLLEAATGVPGARIQGGHLRLPGHGDDGPTMEIFQYDRPEERPTTAVNRLGLAHLAFAVPDVEAARRAVLAAGGSTVGEVVSLPIPGAGLVTFAYVADPEGNILELQRWSTSDPTAAEPPEVSS